ncbi:MAG: helix-turn-helix transcriptional regulator [Cyanobacteria bacterium P01_A01_bin.17]
MPIAVAIMTKMSFGGWLQWRRRHLELSQDDIAVKLNVSRQSVSKWEKDKSAPALNPDQTHILCNLLEVDGATLARAFRGEIEIDD